jgi:hypothetical protein
MEFCIL